VAPDGGRTADAREPLPRAASADASASVEREDFGVQPTAELHAGEMHSPTPNAIPGGQVVTTTGLVDLLKGGQVPVLVLDVLGGPEIIQGAVYAVPAAQPGSYNDPIQQQFAQFLQQATGGNKQYPIVLYCLSPQCWMSYNAALRAIELGYTNVLWYRGGIESWKNAGLPTQPAQR
jgi:rhodanese-related sulfurtransferase